MSVSDIFIRRVHEDGLGIYILVHDRKIRPRLATKLKEGDRVDVMYFDGQRVATIRPAGGHSGGFSCELWAGDR